MGEDEALISAGSPQIRNRTASASRALSIHHKDCTLYPELCRHTAVMCPSAFQRTTWSPWTRSHRRPPPIFPDTQGIRAVCPVCVAQCLRGGRSVRHGGVSPCWRRLSVAVPVPSSATPDGGMQRGAAHHRHSQKATSFVLRECTFSHTVQYTELLSRFRKPSTCTLFIQCTPALDL